MEYKGLSLHDAASEAIRQMAELGGTGGLVAIDRQGNIAMPFNTPECIAAAAWPGNHRGRSFRPGELSRNDKC